jgi:hypothetical protein
MTRDEKIALITRLRDDYDHGFLTPDGVAHFTQPFGFTGHTHLFIADPTALKGLSLANGAPAAQGQDAAIVAEEIAVHLGLSPPGFGGRGWRLRHICNAIIAHLQAQDA